MDGRLFELTLVGWRGLHDGASNLAEAFVFLEHKQQLTLGL